MRHGPKGKTEQCKGPTVYLPCHNQVVHLTGRKSKALERPRLHSCKECGTVFPINATNGQIVTRRA